MLFWRLGTKKWECDAADALYKQNVFTIINSRCIKIKLWSENKGFYMKQGNIFVLRFNADGRSYFTYAKYRQRLFCKET